MGINHHTNGYQRVKGEVKDLVAEEWDDPSRMLLCGRDREEMKKIKRTNISPVQLSESLSFF